MRIMIAIFLLLALAGCGGHPPVVVIPPAPPPVVAPEPPLPPDPLPDPPIPDWILEIYPDARQVWIGSAAFYISGGFTAEHVRKYVGTAFADTQKLRPAAKLEGVFVVKETFRMRGLLSNSCFIAAAFSRKRPWMGMETR